MGLPAETTKQKISQAMIGNQNARAPARLISDCLRKIAVQNPERLRIICDKMLDKAQDDVAAFREIADRIEGKVITQVSVSTTHTVIDADLLSEAGKLLQIMSGHTLDTARVLTDDDQE